MILYFVNLEILWEDQVFLLIPYLKYHQKLILKIW